MWKLLYTSMVRPQLEFVASVWNPSKKHDIEAIEAVQHKATKICYPKMKYEQRLENLQLYTLEERRTRGDLIEIFKIINEFVDIDLKLNVKAEVNAANFSMTTRGNSTRLIRESFPIKYQNDLCSAVTSRHHFLTNRIVPVWNALPEHVVTSRCETTNAFKQSLDIFKKINK